MRYLTLITTALLATTVFASEMDGAAVSKPDKVGIAAALHGSVVTEWDRVTNSDVVPDPLYRMVPAYDDRGGINYWYGGPFTEGQYKKAMAEAEAQRKAAKHCFSLHDVLAKPEALDDILKPNTYAELFKNMSGKDTDSVVAALIAPAAPAIDHRALHLQIEDFLGGAIASDLYPFLLQSRDAAAGTERIITYKKIDLLTHTAPAADVVGPDLVTHAADEGSEEQ